MTLNLSPQSGQTPLSVTFSLNLGSTTAKSIEWNFGDGTPPDTSNTLTTTHIYQKSGSFTGTVDVISNDYTSESQVFYVNVAPSSSNSNQTNTNQNSTTTTTPQMTVTTDQTSYNQGDAIHISGSVNPVESNTAIAVLVRDPLSNLVSEAQPSLSSSGSFSVTLKANGPLWKQAGTYTVIALYDKVANTTTTFSFSGGNGQIIANTPVTSDTFQINAAGQTYSVPYTIKEGTVKSMDVYADKLTLEITIAATSDGSITVDLPRTLMDAKINGTDDNLIVMVSGTPVQFTETKDTNSRALSIPFHSSDTLIDIVGTMIAGSSVTSTPPPTPQPVSVTVSTDRSSYSMGDTIMISGKVQPVIAGTIVSISVFDSYHDGGGVAQLFPASDGSFTKSFISTGYLWKTSGTWTVKVQYGRPEIEATTTFYFNAGNVIPPQPYTQKSSQDGSTVITLKTGPLTSGQPFSISLIFTDPNGNPIKHQNYAVSITQNGNSVLENATAHTHTGFDSQTTSDLSSSNPVDIRVMLNGLGLPGTDPSTWTGPKGDVLNFINIGGNGTQLTQQPTPTPTQQPHAVPQTPPTIPTTILNATTQDLASINDARNNQTIAAEINVVNQTVQTTSINSNVSVQTNNTSPDSLSISVSAPSQTTPKVIVVNIAATTIDIANLKDLGVMYDGASIPPASNIDSILHAKSTDSPSFAIVITQSGAQILILIPHFSTHTITITNMSKVIPAVPEFGSLAGMIIVISIITVVIISGKSRSRFYKNDLMK
ncbi:MAG: PKD domain-containing protein [Nitrosotalea sp.]